MRAQVRKPERSLVGSRTSSPIEGPWCPQQLRSNSPDGISFTNNYITYLLIARPQTESTRGRTSPSCPSGSSHGLFSLLGSQVLGSKFQEDLTISLTVKSQHPAQGQIQCGHMETPATKPVFPEQMLDC